jgi:hypothetical protein
MTIRRRTPHRPTTTEATTMTAGPLRNLKPMEKAIIEFSQVIILGCNAMNKPTNL